MTDQLDDAAATDEVAAAPSDGRSAGAVAAPPGEFRDGDPGPWVLVGEEPGFNRFLSVSLRRYRLPDGREVDWDVLGPKSADGITAGVTVLPLTPEGRIVTIRMFRAGPDAVVTNLPGGLVEPGEDVALAGARELEEETGYTCETLDVVGWQWSGASSTYRKYVAIARLPPGREAAAGRDRGLCPGGADRGRVPCRAAHSGCDDWN
ncbi:NUDIX hydrolase [Kribbella sp. NPDC003557]|uniref:NUDIX hydrolase n=1 Tax=Kribbella sp. NPDC003557 TaxID=3154449 RepID=UPI0033B22A91